MRVAKQEREREEQLAELRGRLQPGDTVYTILDHVSRSGMMRHIRLVLIKCEKDGPHTLHPNYAASVILGLRQETHNGRRGDALVVHGCGMDMGFHVVYNLSRALFPDGFGEKSADGIRPKTKAEAARRVKEGDTSFYGRNGNKSGWDNDGGYALKHRWL